VIDKINSDKSEIPLILIVDDNDSNLQVLASLLMKENCDIAVARNGIEALEFVKMTSPHLILLDVMMPELDGFEACKRLKKDPKTGDIPIIFLSAKTEIEDILQGFELGAVDYVTKPFSSVEVLARVRTQLSLRRSMVELENLNRERKELLHILCHDLTNPIGFIKNSLILVDDGILNINDIKDELYTAADNSLNVINLIRNMMALESKKLKLISVNLHEALEISLTILKHKIDKKKIDVETAIDRELSVFTEQVSFINSVILNILTNAIKFSHHGSTLSISAEKRDSDVFIKIRDRGTGMPESILRNIFSLSHTTSRPGTENEEGTGFGLPLVKKFMEIYGGSIEIESVDADEDPDNSGTTVTLSLKSGGEEVPGFPIALIR
jgi:two-component system, sensor histidine kinase and response regulator